jgi:hypothetical protein
MRAEIFELEDYGFAVQPRFYVRITLSIICHSFGSDLSRFIGRDHGLRAARKKMIPFLQRLVGQMVTCNASETSNAEFSADQAQQETKVRCDCSSPRPDVMAQNQTAAVGPQPPGRRP